MNWHFCVYCKDNVPGGILKSYREDKELCLRQNQSSLCADLSEVTGNAFTGKKMTVGAAYDLSFR